MPHFAIIYFSVIFLVCMWRLDTWLKTNISWEDIFRGQGGYREKEPGNNARFCFLIRKMAMYVFQVVGVRLISLLWSLVRFRTRSFDSTFCEFADQYRAFSHDVTTAMLVFENKGTAAILVYQANPLGIELYFYANTFFCVIKPIWPLVTWVKTLHSA